MGKINLVPSGFDYENLKQEEGFLGKQSAFSFEPIIAATPYPQSDTECYTRVTTPKRIFMASAGTLKKAGLPATIDEGKWEVGYTSKTGLVAKAL